MPSFRWRRLDLPGTDRATLTTTETGYLLLGHAQFLDRHRSVDLRYSVQTSPTWRTQRAHVEGIGPEGPVLLDVTHVPDQPWILNGEAFSSLAGCEDIDLGFTPSTNLVSLRRLHLELGASAEVTAAWLEYPGLRLAPLRQVYDRLPDGRYAYRCPDLPFQAMLKVNEEGFVTSYPPLWEPEQA